MLELFGDRKLKDLARERLRLNAQPQVRLPLYDFIDAVVIVDPAARAW